MHDSKFQVSHELGLRAGDWVEVRSEAEILATLDENGRLDGLPFMPEMLKYCGKRFRVFKSAHKTCDTIKDHVSRRMMRAVHLEGLRCDGEAHGGCQARCLLFWKEDWVKRVSASAVHVDRALERDGSPSKDGIGPRSLINLETLARNVRARSSEGPDKQERYVCQATALREATTSLRWWDPRQYIKDWTSRNVRAVDLVRYLIIAAFNAVMRSHWRGRPYPYIRGLLLDKTPTEVLDLQPGELVQVRSKDEILRTINVHNRNRGLTFDPEMVPFCGRTFRVLSRVERIIDEKTGRMMRMHNACIMLDGVTCGGCFSTNRLFCPRSIYPYWHEIWLRRVEKSQEREDAKRST